MDGANEIRTQTNEDEDDDRGDPLIQGDSTPTSYIVFVFPIKTVVINFQTTIVFYVTSSVQIHARGMNCPNREFSEQNVQCS